MGAICSLAILQAGALKGLICMCVCVCKYYNGDAFHCLCVCCRYDWYQTQAHVIVTLLQKNTKKEDLVVDAQETTVSVCVLLVSC